MDLLVDNVLIIGADEFYRTSRYETSLFVVLINTNDKNAFNILENAIRQTDILQQLDSELLVLFLTHTNHEESLFFMHKIKNQFDFTYTMAEFKGYESEFIETLFLENSKKIEALF